MEALLYLVCWFDSSSLTKLLTLKLRYRHDGRMTMKTRIIENVVVTSSSERLELHIPSGMTGAQLAAWRKRNNAELEELKDEMALNSVLVKAAVACEHAEVKENLEENWLTVSENGRFETNCRNEFGSIHGVIRDGVISLTKAESLAIGRFDFTGRFSCEFHLPDSMTVSGRGISRRK